VTCCKGEKRVVKGPEIDPGSGDAGKETVKQEEVKKEEANEKIGKGLVTGPS